MQMADCEPTRRRLAAALGAPELVAAAAAIDRAGVDEGDSVRLVRAVAEDTATRAPILSLKARLEEAGRQEQARSLERLLLLRAASVHVPDIDSLPVSEDVKRLT